MILCLLTCKHFSNAFCNDKKTNKCCTDLIMQEIYILTKLVLNLYFLYLIVDSDSDWISGPNSDFDCNSNADLDYCSELI